MVRKSFHSFMLIIFSVLLFSSMSYSQSQVREKTSKDVSMSYLTDKQFTDQEVGNLITGIKSDNLGLRRSAIYLAGLYSLDEVVPVLVSQLEKENNSDVKILIALALYRMEDPEGMEAVEKLYRKDDNVRVKRMSKAILDEFNNKFVAREESGG